MTAADCPGGVDDAAQASGFRRHTEHALELLLAVVAVFKGKDFALERAAVGDRDLADSIFRGVDQAGGQGVFALVVDLDRGITARHLDRPLAGADDGAGQADDATGGLDVIEDDGAGVGVKVAVHRGQTSSSVADAAERFAQCIGEIAGIRRRKVIGNRQLNVVDTALQRAVDIQVTRIDVDRAHRKNQGFFLRHRGFNGRDQVGDTLIVIVKKGPFEFAVCVINRRAELGVEVQVLARVGTGVEPVFGGQIEVAGGADIDRRGPDFTGDIDAAFHVGEVERTVGVGYFPAHIQVLRAARGAERTQAAVYTIGLFGQRILGDANHALTARSRCA